MSVGAEEDAGEDEFVVAGGDQGAGLGDRVGEGFAPEGGAELGDDAVGAVGVAAVLDLQVGALSAGLALAVAGVSSETAIAAASAALRNGIMRSTIQRFANARN